MSDVEHLAVHPVAELLPPLSDDEYAALKSSIADFGLAEPIILYEGMILDGRHRYRACVETDMPIMTRNYGGEQPLAYILGVNLARRNLTESQRSVLFLKIEGHLEAEQALAVAREKAGKRIDTLFSEENRVEAGRVHEILARRFAMPPGRMAKLLAVANNAADLVQYIESGEMSVDRAYWTYRKEKDGVAKGERGRSVRAVSEWEVDEPSSRSFPAWQKAFRAQRNRARALYQALQDARDAIMAREASVHELAHQAAIEELIKIKDDRDLRDAAALAYVENRIKMPRALALTGMNPRQFQAHVAHLRGLVDNAPSDDVATHTGG